MVQWKYRWVCFSKTRVKPRFAPSWLCAFQEVILPFFHLSSPTCKLEKARPPSPLIEFWEEK